MNEQEIYIEALERTDPADRKAYLDEACAGDPALRERVEHLIRQSDQLGSFLEHPPLEAVTGAAEGHDATLLLANGSTEDDEAVFLKRKAMNQNPADPDEEIPLDYLEPATRPDSLGRLGHYEVLNVVGKGAFGTVLRAFDTKLERIVAIKVMALEMASLSPARKRFLREARTSAQIRHENVVGIYSVEEKPIPYLVMEYIPGKTLQQQLDEQGPLSLPNVLRLGKQIADGLAAAHEQGLIHRDIKPGNILLEGGMNERVKVTDFGLARTADDASMTQSGMIAGTPMYMAPEQAQGHKLDHRADLFSLGSVLYQMLSGRPPFRAANTVAVLKRVVEDAPRPIQEVIPEVPTWVCELVSHLHAKNPEQRFQSAKDVSDLLAKCLDDLKAGRVPKIPRPSRSTADPSEPATVNVSKPDQPPRRQALRRNPLVRVAAAVVTVLGVLGITEVTGVTKLASIATRWTTATTAPVVQKRPAPQSSTQKPQHTGWHGWPADAPKPAVAPFNAEQAKQHQEAWAKYLNVPVEYTNSIGMKFRLIPPGEFTMGSTPQEIAAALKDVDPNDKHWQECIKSEAPQHKVILTQPIYLGVNEVTQAEYEKVMGVNPSHFAPMGMGKEAVAGMETTDHPVEMVSWNDAAEFCAKLSNQEELKPFYFRAGETITPLDGTGYRLPSEAEWEFACRAGTVTKYWIGDKDEDLVRAGWFGGNSGGRTHTAGELKSNPFGLADIHGNVWEWVQDGWDATFYGQFQEKSAINPNSPFSAGSQRVLRGGSWGNSASHCRSSDRYARDCTHRDHGIGFRLSLTVDAVKTAIGESTTKPAVVGWHGWPADAPAPAIAPFDAEQAQQHQAAWAKYLNVPVEYTNSIGMKFRLIPPGEFMMGMTKDEAEAVAVLGPLGPNDEYWKAMSLSSAPAHKVRLTQAYYVGTYEVTQEQYEKVMGVNPSSFSAKGQDKDKVAGEDTKQHPVEMVSFVDAAEFCIKLSKQEQLKPVYFSANGAITLIPGDGYRLPMEAEWEYACRAGTNTAWFHGEQESTLGTVAWLFSNSGGMTHRVGQLKANPFGLYDVHGNVWEWCQDWHDSQAYAQRGTGSTVNPRGPDAGSARVLRGGGWGGHAPFCRSALRNAGDTSFRSHADGFRVSLSVDAVKAARTPPTAFAEFLDADVQRIAALPAAEQVEEVRKALKARNPDFDGMLTPTFDGDAVVGLKFSTERVKDVSPVRALTKLTKLEAAGPEDSRGLLTDLSVLKGLPLNDLVVAHNDISDLAPLRGMPIRRLFLDRNPVKDFAPLHDLPLRVLLINRVPLNTLKPLEGLKLEHLDCIGLPITDLSPLKGMPLKILMLASADVSDLTPLTGMKLEYLNLQATKVSDLSPLKGMPLMDLHIGETQVTDLSPLKDIPLKKLFGDFLPTRDAAILREIKTLEIINDQPAAEYLK